MALPVKREADDLQSEENLLPDRPSLFQERKTSSVAYYNSKLPISFILLLRWPETVFTKRARKPASSNLTQLT